MWLQVSPFLGVLFSFRSFRTMWLPYKTFFVILHILAFPLYLIVISVLALYKLCVCLLAKTTQDFVGTISGSDSLFLSDPIWTRPDSSIVFAVEVNGDITEEEAINIFQKVYDQKDAKGRRCYRELGYYLVLYLGYGFWKKVPNFKIGDRIHILKKGVAPEGNGLRPNNSATSKASVVPEEPLSSLVEGMLRDGYEKEQPLWDIYLLYNYNGKPNRPLVIGRFHHLMADGMSFVKLFYALCGSNKLPETFTKPSNSMQKWDRMANSVLVKIGTGLNLLTVGFIDYLYEVLIAQDKHSIHFNEHGKLKITGDWICSTGSKLEIRQLKKASKSLGYSIVHVILAGISNGLESYFYKYHSAQPIPEGFHFVLPLPIPKHPDMRLVNHWTLAKVRAKFGIEGIVAQLEYFKKETKRCAASTLVMIAGLTFKYVCQLLPVCVVDFVSRARATFTVMLSNVVGPQENMRLGQSMITDMYFWMPIAQESMALSAGVISCNGGLRICLTADRGCIPDRSRLEDLGMMIYAELNNICEMGNTAASGL